MLFRDRMLGGVSSLALMAPDGVDGGGGGDDRHTDVVLQDLAAAAFDTAAEAADTAGDGAGTAPARAAEKGAGELKPAATAKDASAAQKTAPERPAGEDRGDGRRTNGQFARKTPAELAAEAGKTGSHAKPAGQDGQGAPDPAAGDAGQAKAAPPPSWSPTAKAAWEKLPDAVRADIAKRELEISNGFKQYEGVKPFAERAAKGGQTLAQALTAYTGIEELVRRDFAGGVMHIAQNAGLTQHEAARVFGQIAQRLGFQFSAPAAQPAGGSPGDQKLGADPNVLQELLKPVLEPILQKVNALEGTFGARLRVSKPSASRLRSNPSRHSDRIPPTATTTTSSRRSEICSSVAWCSARETSPPILKAAYEMACWQNPEIRELLINERSAAAEEQRQSQAREQAAKARAASRSVTGAPAPGAREQPTRRGDQLNQLAAAAYDQAAGRV
jgi:hypothetical protein